MIDFYLATAVLIAVTLNHRRPLVRALGRIAAALALSLIASSILLANLDGTFDRAGGVRPWVLNIEAVLAITAAGALFWTVPFVMREPESAPLPLTGSAQRYGQINRLLHWSAAALIIAAVPMGQFVAVLAPQAGERAGFLAVHMAIGAAVFLLVAARMVVRLASPAPSVPVPAMAAHAALYALLIALCLTGFALAPSPVQLYGLGFPRLPPSVLAEALHRLWLPVLLAALFALHLAGARTSIRRMAR